VFAHLVEELVFSRENPAEWNIVHSSIDARGKNRILRCEEETIQQLFKSKSFFRKKLGISPQLKNASEIQLEPYLYADLIILSFSVFHWIKFRCCPLLSFIPNKVKFSVENETMLRHLIGVT